MNPTHYQFVNIVYTVRDSNTYKLDVYNGGTASGQPIAEVLIPKKEDELYYKNIPQSAIREYLLTNFNITFDFEYPSYKFSDEAIFKWNSLNK